MRGSGRTVGERETEPVLMSLATIGTVHVNNVHLAHGWCFVGERERMVRDRFGSIKGRRAQYFTPIPVQKRPSLCSALQAERERERAKGGGETKRKVLRMDTDIEVEERRESE